jgi:putative PIN family toxin of toxin-antitoxin system
MDSNVLITLLVFEDPHYPRIAAAWHDARLRVTTNIACAAEFKRVLAYRQLKLAGDRQAAVYAEFEKRTHTFADCGKSVMEGGAVLPRCADEDDQKFLELAAACAADCLVTGDRALLRLARRVPFAIVTAGQLERRLAG